MTTDPVASGLGSAPGRDGDRLLRRSLNLDAVASGGLGLLLAAAGSLLDEPLGIPASVLVPVGVFLVAYAAALWFVGSRPRVRRPAVLVVVVGNLLWVVASVVAAIAGWWSPTPVGTAFVLAQAAAVALFAELQFTGLRRARVEMA
jgi:CHASE2 domain-containing sensor protein